MIRDISADDERHIGGDQGISCGGLMQLLKGIILPDLCPD